MKKKCQVVILPVIVEYDPYCISRDCGISDCALRIVLCENSYKENL